MGNIFKGIGKSAAKAVKYVGLSAAALAVTGVSGVFDPAELLRLINEILTLDPTAELLVSLLSEAVGGAVGPFLAIVIQQLIKHRDALKGP